MAFADDSVFGNASLRGAEHGQLPRALSRTAGRFPCCEDREAC